MSEEKKELKEFKHDEFCKEVIELINSYQVHPVAIFCALETIKFSMYESIMINVGNQVLEKSKSKD